MRTILNWSVLFVLSFWSASCSRQKQAFSNPSRTGHCPLYFSSENLCAEISWEKGPSADLTSAFFVTFWNKDSGSSTGPLTDPSSQVGAFLRMSCCGSLFFPKTEKIASGKFLTSGIHFTPGNWEVYVQLKQGDNVDKQMLRLQIDD